MKTEVRRQCLFAPALNVVLSECYSGLHVLPNSVGHAQ
jgi:hypothetical protein